MNKRLIITSTISIILISILMISSTYSIFTTNDIDEESNVYTTGNLNITYTIDSNNITFSEKEPINIEDANTVIPYRITVKNEGTVPYMFDLILEDTTSTEVIDYQYIMTKVGYLEPKSLSNCTDNVIKEDIILPAGETVDIDVRVWLSDTLQNTEIDKSFFAKLKVDGIAIYDKNETIDNSILSLVYMKKLFNDNSTYDPSYFHSEIYLDFIKTASFVNYIDTVNVVVSWDVSVAGDGSVMAWITNNETEGYYDLYIGAKNIIFAKDLSYLFYGMKNIDMISLDNLDTSLCTDMTSMFDNTAYNNSNFTLTLNEFFNTSNVTEMAAMFAYTGYNSQTFTLDLGNKFNTSKATNMRAMFAKAGYNSPIFTIDLGEKFNTKNVVRMDSMFYDTGYNSEIFTLNLGEHFDTSQVTNMYGMFLGTGFYCKVFSLDLGKYFNTSQVTNMQGMFYYTGYSNDNLELDLSTFTFDKVTSYDEMFGGFYSTKTIYVANESQQSWILNKNFENVTSDNVLIKSS